MSHDNSIELNKKPGEKSVTRNNYIEGKENPCQSL